MAAAKSSPTKERLVAAARDQLAVSLESSGQGFSLGEVSPTSCALQVHAFAVTALFGRGGFGHVYRATCSKS